MKILVVAPRVPWPPLDGGRVAINAVALGLRDAGADVELVALNPRKHRSDSKEVLDRRGAIAVTAVPHDSARSPLRLLVGLLQRPSVIAARFSSPELEALVRERVSRGDVDVVQIEGPMLAGCIAASRVGKARTIVAMRAQNAEHAIWERLARGARWPWSRVAMRRIASQLREHERAANDACDALVTISPGDLETFRRLGFAKPGVVIPIGIDIGANEPSVSSARGIFFIGSLDYRPNAEALLWLAEQVMPLVRRASPSVEVVAAGSNASHRLIERATAAGIRFVGQVPDARAFMSASGVMAVPLLSGSGVRVKIAEAMALGVPVVSTTRGAEGLALENDREIVIADSAERFATALVRIESDPMIRERLATAARAYVARELDREELGRRLLHFYRDLRP